MFRSTMAAIMDTDDKMSLTERTRIQVKVVDRYDLALRIWKHNTPFAIIPKIKGSKERT